MYDYALVDKGDYFFAGNEKPLLDTWVRSPYYSKFQPKTFSTFLAAQGAHQSIAVAHYQNFRIVEVNKDKQMMIVLIKRTDGTYWKIQRADWMKMADMKPKPDAGKFVLEHGVMCRENEVDRLINPRSNGGSNMDIILFMGEKDGQFVDAHS